MPGLPVLRALALVSAVAVPLGACVSGPANPSAGRASELANLVSRSVACRAGAPRASTLERFIASERARGATPEQLASARATYVTISEAETINHGIKPQACDPEERATIKAKMVPIRAGDFSAL
ncbi:hypothetical protein ASE63_18035 [Bosea sp. Root381]|uniref:hypothetical protein n=1 Tax=Bosea sp. Root381 TaxID=1736524 RepID=UPI0006F4FD2E|nr:hypothetical protein [Bosea sp. Root381]KRE13906.1 hypothetical protein ASE63_18035 [Bosea sp. Root381]